MTMLVVVGWRWWEPPVPNVRRHGVVKLLTHCKTHVPLTSASWNLEASERSRWPSLLYPWQQALIFFCSHFRSNSFHCSDPVTAIGNNPFTLNSNFKVSHSHCSLCFPLFSRLSTGCREFSILDQFRELSFVLYCSNYRFEVANPRFCILSSYLVFLYFPAS
ncbi:hypothetical protein E2542_SST20045 [Spatholobus suberectus]|nr:hypothetical protein E2542_SST20045 [Spatholobus suberectus]